MFSNLFNKINGMCSAVSTLETFRDRIHDVLEVQEGSRVVVSMVCGTVD